MKARRDRHLILLLTVCGLLAGVTLPSPAHAMSKAEQRKLESAAKKAFYSSDYEKAKEIYSTLISEFDDFIYLRNIARCYEQMKQPGPALDNFRAYLKKAGSTLSDKEQQEIAERMASMEKLQAETTQAEAQKPEPPVAPPTTEAPPPGPAPFGFMQAPPALAVPAPESALPPAMPIAGEGPAQTGNVDLSQQPASSQSSVLKGVGIGLLIASGVAAVVGGVLMYSSWSTYGSNKDGKCDTASACASARDSVDTKNLWSKISFGVAAGAAVFGGTFTLTAPSPKASRDVSLGMRWSY